MSPRDALTPLVMLAPRGDSIEQVLFRARAVPHEESRRIRAAGTSSMSWRPAFDALFDRFESELKRGFAIMLFTSQAVLIAILSVLILAFD
jgi:hypothetical protein